MEASDILASKRLFVVSNRLPYNPVKTQTGIQYRLGPGGLVAALDPMLRNTHGVWVGWDGGGVLGDKSFKKIEVGESPEEKYQLSFIPLTEREIENYYHGFSNRTLWPLFHGFTGITRINRHQWEIYKAVNQKFTQTVLKESRSDDFVWIHDYHLMLVPGLLKEWDIRSYFFLHTPFPHYEIFRILPWRREILDGILGSHLVGFHVESYARNFLDCVERICEYPVDWDARTVVFPDRKVKIRPFPISIDYQRLADQAASRAVEESLRRIRSSIQNRHVILGIDRLDYTKGIKERLLAIERFLEKYPPYRNNVLFVQLALPSRTRVKEYLEMKREIDQLVGHINGRFTVEGPGPIRYVYRQVPFNVLMAYYRLASVCLVTPLRDGMNLVAKEYVSCNLGRNGVMVLSELAGASEELKEALLINPYNIEEVADVIAKALDMPADERMRRMQTMQDHVKKHDIHRWVGDFVEESQSSS